MIIIIVQDLFEHYVSAVGHIPCPLYTCAVKKCVKQMTSVKVTLTSDADNHRYYDGIKAHSW